MPLDAPARERARTRASKSNKIGEQQFKESECMRKKRRARVIVRHAQGKEGASSYLVSAIFFYFFRTLGKRRGFSKQPKDWTNEEDGVFTKVGENLPAKKQKNLEGTF